MKIPGEEDLTYVMPAEGGSSTEGVFSNPYAVPLDRAEITSEGAVPSLLSSEEVDANDEPSSSKTTGIAVVDDPVPSSEEDAVNNDASNVGNSVATSSSPSLDSPHDVSPNKNCLGNPRQHCVAYAGCAPMFGK